MDIDSIIERISSPHADKIYMAKDYTKADLIRDLQEWWDAHQESDEWASFHAERK